MEDKDLKKISEVNENKVSEEIKDANQNQESVNTNEIPNEDKDRENKELEDIIPRIIRERIPIVVHQKDNSDEIVWLCGIRKSKNYFSNSKEESVVLKIRRN